MEECRLTAVYLTKDVSADTSQFLGTIFIPATEKSCEYLRKSLSSESSSDLQLTFNSNGDSSSFVFVTPHGWEVSAGMEKDVKIRDIVCSGNIIKIRLKDAIPRLGIVIVGDSMKETALGFIHVPALNSRVSELRKHLEKQHPSLYKRLVDSGFQFLDNNGWPITREQEDLLMTIQVITNNVIKVHQLQVPCANISPTLSPIPPVIEIAKVDEESFEHEKLRATPPPHPSLPNRLSMPRMSLKPFDVMISYVHRETAKVASLLCDELRRLNLSVFVDVQYIKPGIDWQDVLNEAVYNCSLFIPLISDHYGLTDWTNKEVKLADTLEKFIVPVNFMPVWPPMCLAIQFATTQFIRWGKNAASNVEPRTIASKVAAEISERYKTVQEMKDMLDKEEEEKEGEEEERKVEDGSKATQEGKSSELAVKPKLAGKKFSTVIRKSLLKKDSVTTLTVVSYHPQQADIVEGIQAHLEGRGYEVWASSAGTDHQKRQQFKTKVNEAGVVLFILSKQFAMGEWCEQEVYYCEGRKRIIPIVVESIEMPCWMSTLIGTETFLDTRSNSFYDSLTEEVECATQPSKVEGRLRKLVEQKTQLHRMCNNLQKNLPVGKLVYISGGTKFFSQNGEAICRELGKCLAQDRNIVLVTGGFYGVGETVGRSFYEERRNLGWEDGIIHVQALKDDQDRSLQTRQNADGTFKPVPYGKTLFIGSSIRQREMLTAKCLDLCILIEGGPGAAFEAHQFSWNDHTVIPIKVTGGAAGGKFNVPQTIFIKPINVPESEWLTLQDEKASPVEIAKAVTSIVAMTKIA